MDQRLRRLPQRVGRGSSAPELVRLKGCSTVTDAALLVLEWADAAPPMDVRREKNGLISTDAAVTLEVGVEVFSPDGSISVCGNLDRTESSAGLGLSKAASSPRTVPVSVPSSDSGPATMLEVREIGCPVRDSPALPLRFNARRRDSFL
jgi:hypothetical protein